MPLFNYYILWIFARESGICGNLDRGFFNNSEIKYNFIV